MPMMAIGSLVGSRAWPTAAAGSEVSADPAKCRASVSTVGYS